MEQELIGKILSSLFIIGLPVLGFFLSYRRDKHRNVLGSIRQYNDILLSKYKAAGFTIEPEFMIKLMLLHTIYHDNRYHYDLECLRHKDYQDLFVVYSRALCSFRMATVLIIDGRYSEITHNLDIPEKKLTKKKMEVYVTYIDNLMNHLKDEVVEHNNNYIKCCIDNLGEN